MDLELFGAYVFFAVAYATVGYMKKVSEEEATFDLQKFGKTVIIGVVAGLIMAHQGLDMSAEGYGAIVAIAIPIADQVWNHLSYMVNKNMTQDEC